MRVMCIVTATSSRSFEVEKDGKKESVKVVEIDMTDGIDNFHASAFDKLAQQIIDHPLNPGTLVNCDLAFSTKVVKTEKGDFVRQDVRLTNYAPLYG